MTDDQINQMVSRFLAWRLPEDFTPDGGISFTPMLYRAGYEPILREPVGTNLLTFTQAKAMVQHMVADLTPCLDALAMQRALTHINAANDVLFNSNPGLDRPDWVAAVECHLDDAGRALTAPTPADALAEARRLPEIKALVEAAQTVLDRGYVSECIPEERDDSTALRAALAALTEGR